MLNEMKMTKCSVRLAVPPVRNLKQRYIVGFERQALKGAFGNCQYMATLTAGRFHAVRRVVRIIAARAFKVESTEIYVRHGCSYILVHTDINLAREGKNNTVVAIIFLLFELKMWKIWMPRKQDRASGTCKHEACHIVSYHVNRGEYYTTVLYCSLPGISRAGL